MKLIKLPPYSLVISVTLLFLFECQGCTTFNSTSLTKITATPVSKTQGTRTVVAPTFTATAVITSITASPSPTMEAPLPSPTWTLPPTISPVDASIRVHEFLTDNAGCRLPCWWGISPGKTTWEETRNFLIPFASNDARTFPPGDPSSFFSTFHFLINKGVEVRTTITVHKNIVSEIQARYINVPSYTIHNFLQSYGAPQEIWMATYSDKTQEGNIPFYLFLFYPDKGILAYYYSLDSTFIGDQIQKCFRDTVVSDTVFIFILWSPEQKMNFQQANAAFGLEGLVPFDNLNQIKEVTGMNTEKFTEEFTKVGSVECLKTPRSFWKSNYQ